MIRYSSQVSVARPPADVLAALLDPELYARWMDMVDVRFEGGGPPHVGTRGGFRVPAGPLKGDYSVEIVALEPATRLEMRIESGQLSWLFGATLEPAGDGTALTYAGEISLLGWRRALEPAVAREAQAIAAQQVERFKSVVESE